MATVNVGALPFEVSSSSELDELESDEDDPLLDDDESDSSARSAARSANFLSTFRFVFFENFLFRRLLPPPLARFIFHKKKTVLNSSKIHLVYQNLDSCFHNTHAYRLSHTQSMTTNVKIIRSVKMALFIHFIQILVCCNSRFLNGFHE